MSRSEGLEIIRRGYLLQTADCLHTYIARGHPVRLKTVKDTDMLAELSDEVGDHPMVFFVIEDWGAFRELMEPNSLSGYGARDGNGTDAC